jgi:TolB protein
MMKLKSSSISKTCKALRLAFWLGPLLIFLIYPCRAWSRIYVDINAPSIQKIKIAIPDFKNLSTNKEYMELATALPDVLSNDLDLTGYFTPMDKEAFLEEDKASMERGEIRFKNWSVIGADLLLKAGYRAVGRSLEVEVRLYDVFWGREILGRRALGKVADYRTLIHRVGNEIIYALTGHKGMFLSKLAFVGTATGNKELYVSDFDGYNWKQVTSDKSIALLPRWSPRGEKILFNSYKDGGPMLYMTDFATGNSKRISGRDGLNIGAAWAPDGEKVALTLSHKGNPDIYEIDLSGKIIDKLTDHWGIDVSPTFSPDGAKMAFVSDRSGSPQIYVRDLGSGSAERLTFEGNYNTSPSWSNLNRIVFSAMKGGRFNIYVMDSDGRNLKMLTEGQGNNEDPCWSPDGRYIVFSSNRDGGYHLYIMNANGRNQRRITFLRGEQTSPTWSPF